MSHIDYITDQERFTSLWQRALLCKERVANTTASEFLHFDSSNIGTEIFRDLIRKIATFTGAEAFAMIVLDPDPFDYFHAHFGRYPGFIVDTAGSDAGFFDILLRDPGDSPADAIGHYSEKYAVLPISGDWFMYADRGWEWGTGFLGGSPHVIEFAMQNFKFYENPT